VFRCRLHSPDVDDLGEAVMQPKVAITPTCVECGDVWLPADTDCWKLHLDVDDEPVWLCPECDERESGG
jgi:hypothetical protein